ncbi:MAG TPA: Rrf2 family transcriptional regulator [Thermoclostridium sp.]|nr:Rrf2 family transcriptional regulator [Clostridiaceae bacterium]HOQ75510.1 Rrf2 family transcriptional regulator [Thermoclostridium sp.]HPU45245.1 Rrf2 family transcriptional regulator [Thermoclostridium sp.]
MKISTRGRYALRLMLDLALNDPDEYVTIRSISERQEISYKYLEQIISVLNRGGLVKSVRGSQGGYRLAHPPEEYTVGMILRQIEGNLVPVACMEDEPNQCPRSNKCVTLTVWKELGDAINNVLDSITLADLVERARAQGENVVEGICQE